MRRLRRLGVPAQVGRSVSSRMGVMHPPGSPGGCLDGSLRRIGTHHSLLSGRTEAPRGGVGKRRNRYFFPGRVSRFPARKRQQKKTQGATCTGSIS